ncbi:g7671 [Coccomyxa elongata]
MEQVNQLPGANSAGPLHYLRPITQSTGAPPLTRSNTAVTPASTPQASSVGAGASAGAGAITAGVQTAGAGADPTAADPTTAVPANAGSTGAAGAQEAGAAGPASSPQELARRHWWMVDAGTGSAGTGSVGAAPSQSLAVSPTSSASSTAPLGSQIGTTDNSGFSPAANQLTSTPAASDSAAGGQNKL